MSDDPAALLAELRVHETALVFDRKCRVVDRYSASSDAVGVSFLVDGSSFDESSRLDTERSMTIPVGGLARCQI